MKIYVVNNLDTGQTIAFDTEDKAKDGMRSFPGMYLLRLIEVGPGREGAVALYNHIIQPEQVQKETTYESKKNPETGLIRLREQK